MQVSRKELLTALEPLKPAFAGRSVVTALTHIWFDGHYAYAHDGGVGARTKLETPFKLGVPGGLLLGLLGQSGPDDLTLTETDAALTFKAGRSNVKLATLPIDQRVWPYDKEGKEKAWPGPVKASLKVTKGFMTALKRVFVIRPANPKRMEHHAVCVFGIGDAEMDLFTTDSATLAVMSLVEPLGGKADSIAIPRSFAEQLATNCQYDKELKMYADHFVVEASPELTLYSNVYDTADILDLPGYAEKYADDKAAPSFPLPEEFSAALERVVLMAGLEDAVVSLHTEGKSLSLTGSFKLGELDDEFEVSKALPKCTVPVVAKTLLSVRDVNTISVGKHAVTLRGKDKFTYILAQHEAPTKKVKKAKE
jgi:hypothetical protein